MYQHLEEAPTPLRELVPGVPAELEQLVMDLLAKRPTDRPDSAWSVYDRLVPFLPKTDLSGTDPEPPRGALPDPTRPYRSPGAPRPRPGVARPPAAEPTVVASTVDEQDIDDALAKAEELVDDDRFTQASDLLAELIPKAAAQFGRDGSSVLDLRVNYAATLFLGGDFRRAAPQFESLAAAFERIEGPDGEQTLEYRRQALVCRIALGETDTAIPQLESILRGFGNLGEAFTRDVLDLRLVLARLRIGAGHLEQAEAELLELHDDALHALGADDELTDEIQQMAVRGTRYRRTE